MQLNRAPGQPHSVAPGLVEISSDGGSSKGRGGYAAMRTRWTFSFLVRPVVPSGIDKNGEIISRRIVRATRALLQGGQSEIDLKNSKVAR